MPRTSFIWVSIENVKISEISETVELLYYSIIIGCIEYSLDLRTLDMRTCTFGIKKIMKCLERKRVELFFGIQDSDATLSWLLRTKPSYYTYVEYLTIFQSR